MERLGAYRIESLLGRGGMGEVYLAWDEWLERRVAIKRVRAERLAEPTQRKRFLREARAVARLDHPAIVRVHHVLEHEDLADGAGSGYALVMEYVEGRELGEVLARGEIDVLQAVEIGCEIADGLGAAHARGIVHRDLKLSNVMIDREGRVRILDFGLARALWSGSGEGADEERLTHTGMLLGTVHAMSPEQATGRAVDHRSDLFALGGLLYELLAGRAPFRGATLVDSLRRVTTEEPEPVESLVELPEALARLVASLLKKDPEARPASARQVAQRLSAIADRLADRPTNPLPFVPAPGEGDPDLPTAVGPAPGISSRPESPLSVGQSVPRRANWILAERLGEGGFGEVWLARHKSGEERVFKFCFEPERLRALKREVTLFRLLRETLGRRRDIARVIDWDFGEAPYFLEAEYTAGGDLVRWAEHCGGLDTVPLEARIKLVAEVAEALAAAHSVGVLHKDVKPHNVLVVYDDDGRPRARLTDFGIGLLTERDRLRDPGFTVQGFTETALANESPAGTVAYMAPELLSGEPATIEADVYSLGVLLFQVAAGDFSRPLAPGWRREIEDELLIEDVAACVDGVPGRRLRSAGELAERLRGLEERRERRRAEREAERLRERARRRRRIAGWAGAFAVVLLLVVSIFAYQVYEARNRELAARRSAEERRQQAEGLIDFMLGDLRGKLQPVGKLDVLRDVGDRAMEYFAAVPEEELSDEEMASYAKALHQIGQVRFGLGEIAEATAAFEESLSQAKRLAARDPDNAERQFELGQSHFWLGFLRFKERHHEAALEQFEAYQRISEALVQRNPANADWQLELAFSHSNIGQILLERGELEGAARALEASLAIFERLVKERPDDLELRVEMAHVVAKLGETLRARGELAGSLERFREALATYERAAGAAGAAVELWNDVGTMQDYAAELLLALGDADGALSSLESSLEAARRLADHDPENSTWRGVLARRLQRLARAHAAAGRPDLARDPLAESEKIVAAALRRNSHNGRWRLARAHNHCARAMVFLASDARDAVAAALACRVILEELVFDLRAANQRRRFVFSVDEATHHAAGRLAAIPEDEAAKFESILGGIALEGNGHRGSPSHAGRRPRIAGAVFELDGRMTRGGGLIADVSGCRHDLLPWIRVEKSNLRRWLRSLRLSIPIVASGGETSWDGAPAGGPPPPHCRRLRRGRWSRASSWFAAASRKKTSEMAPICTRSPCSKA